MPTQTERHLKMIEDNIEIIQNIQADVGSGKPSRRQRKLAITCLEAIGASMRHVPDDFREKYNEIPWSAIDCWGTQGTFTPNNFRKSQLERSAAFLSVQKSAISRHSGGETKIQKGVLNNLHAQYEELSRNWHNQILLPYVLISITGILFVIRTDLVQEEIDLTTWESILYGIHVIVIFYIGIYTQTRPSNSDIANDIYTWNYTHTDFYNRSYRNWSLNITDLQEALRRHEFIRAILTVMWMWTLAAAIFVTVIAVA